MTEPCYCRALTIQRDLGTLEQLAVLYYSAGRPGDSLAVYKEIDFVKTSHEPSSVVRYVRFIVEFVFFKIVC